MKREGEILGKTTKKWLVIALGTLILILTYTGVFKQASTLFYGIMCCLVLYAYILIETPLSWDHEKGLKNCLMMILQEGFRLISILLFLSMFFGPDEFKKGTLMSMALGLVLGIPVGYIRYRTHLIKDDEQ